MRKLWIILFLLIGYDSMLTAQTLNIISIDGSQQMVGLDEVEKLYFVTGVMLLDQTNGETDVFPFDEIQQLNFTPATGDVEYNDLELQTLFLFPNPVSNQLSVQFSGSEFQNKQLEIYNASGILQQSESILAVTASKIFSIDASALPAGLYLCKVSGENQTSISKFIKK